MPNRTQATFTNLNTGKSGGTAEEVAERLRQMISNGELCAGDRLPPERDLAKLLGVSRPTLRSGIRTLTTVGILHSRQGAGTFVVQRETLPTLDSSSLEMLSALHGFTSDEMFDTLSIIQIGIAGLAAERATNEHLSALAEEIKAMNHCLYDAEQYQVHEKRFFQTIASASHNRILAALMKMIAEAEHNSQTESSKQGFGSKDLTEQYKTIFEAISSGDRQAAGKAMRDHLLNTRDS